MTLEHELIGIIGGERDRNGRIIPPKSYADAYGQLHMARQIARDLSKRFPHLKHADQLAGRHVKWLVSHWQERELSTGTIKNRLTTARNIYRKLGKGHMLLKVNEGYGIGKRPLRKESRACELTDEILEAIESRYEDGAAKIRASLKLMRWWGLRVKESTMIKPREAIEYGPDGEIAALHLRSTWAKNGRERRIPVSSEVQREVVKEALEVAGIGALIGRHHNYRQWKRHLFYCCDKAGLRDRHALRHRYAQMRFEQLAGCPAPIIAVGRGEGIDLGWIEDNNARLQISAELGHGREAVVASYVGRLPKN